MNDDPTDRPTASDDERLTASGDDPAASPNDGALPPVRRRTILRTVSASAAAASLAGCFSSSEGDTPSSSDDDGDENGGDDENDGDENGDDSTDDENGSDENGSDENGDDDEEADVQGEYAGKAPCLPARPGDDAEVVSTIDDDVTEDTTLEAGLHRVTDHVDIEGGATLTIEAGATVSFAQDAGFVVGSEGTLTALGTCEEPILLTGDEEIRGYWHGIYFDDSLKTDNRLAYAVVEYGGNAEDDTYSHYSDAAVGLYGESYASIDHCKITESPGYGVRIGPQATLDSCERNAFTGNALGPAEARANTAHHFDETSTYTGNDVDRIRVRGGGGGSDVGGAILESQTVTWQNLDAPYYVVPTRVDGDLDVYGDLTVEPETTIVFAQNTALRAYEGGSIALDGGDPAENEPITLTGEVEERGYWKGLFYQDTSANANLVRNAVIEYGGRGSLRDAPAAANLVVAQGSRVEIAETTLRESGDYGLSMHSYVSFPTFEGNTITENANAPVNTSATAAHNLNASNAYTGNNVDEIRMWGGYDTHQQGGGGVDEDMDVTWKKLDVDYHLDHNAAGVETEINGDLTIEPGVTIRLTENAVLHARGSGTITAVGTEDEPITFTGSSEVPGHWGGLWFDETKNNRNEIRHAIVEYAGSHSPLDMSDPANVIAMHGAAVTVADSTIRHSGGYGFGIMYPKSDTFDEDRSSIDGGDNTFENNAMGESYVHEFPY